MSTRKLSDKEFDRYARNILKKPESVAFDKAAWAAMEQQIAQEGATSSFWSLKWIIPAGVILLSSIGYIGFRNDSQIDQAVAEVNSPINESQPTSKEAVVSIGESEQPLDQPSTNASLALATHEASSGQQAELAASQTINPVKSAATISQPIQQETVIVEGTENTTDAETNPTQIAEITKQEEITTPQDVAQKENSSAIEKDPDDHGLQNAGTPLEESTFTSSVLDADNEEATPTSTPLFVNSRGVYLFSASIERPKLIPRPQENYLNEMSSSDSIAHQEDLIQSFSRWSLGLVLAPDFTTVGQLNEFTSPGLDVGITVEYFISKKLSITTGAILTRKLYNTSDIEQYTVPSGFWNGSDLPEEILANCKVIDIPINLRYRLRQGKRTSFFASAGISSYLMLNEVYDYDYGYGQSGGSQPTRWEVSNENNHFFGVYNLSVGITRKVGNNISIEAEPFLNNSLGGVGWGQVRLKSTGAHFHLKYHF